MNGNRDYDTNPDGVDKILNVENCNNRHEVLQDLDLETWEGIGLGFTRVDNILFCL